MLVLETERLILRHLTLDDAPFVRELVNEPGWIRNIGDRGVDRVEDAERYLRKSYLDSYAEHGFGMYLVAGKADGVSMGICGLIKRDTLADVDIGFAFLARFGGRGYAFESAAAVMAHARDALGLRRVVAITIAENTPSRRLLEKLGMRLEKVLPPSDEPEELLLYAWGDPPAAGP
jgi:RimJ/RimL family protein N-acetyltransferase